VLAVSNHTRQRLLVDFALDPAKTGLLPNTFEPARFMPAPKAAYLLERFRITLEQPLILTVGRLAGAERYKGYDQILRALPEIRAAIPDVRYILGGTGPDQARIKALVKSWRLDDTVVLPGFIPEAELPDFYNLCDVFAMPSSGEGFGIVFLEALSCGKPVLAGSKDGSVEALLQGELGVLVNPDDIPAISKALIEMLTGHHPLPILREPHLLRSKVIDAYGYPKFRETLGEQLSALPDRKARLPRAQP
jgi:glycosyltransferase involved in cell wall biosynthesis